MKAVFIILACITVLAVPAIAVDEFDDIPSLPPPPGSSSEAPSAPAQQQETPPTTPQQTQPTKNATNTTTGSSTTATTGSSSTNQQQTTTTAVAAENSANEPLPLDESAYVTPETSEPTEEEPAGLSLTGNAMLYGLLGVVAVLVLTVGMLVAGVIKRHHEGVEATKTLIHDQDLSQHVMSTGSEAATLVHHPSIDEARTFIGMLRSRGYSDAQIRDHFASHGWTDEQIAMAMRH